MYNIDNEPIGETSSPVKSTRRTYAEKSSVLNFESDDSENSKIFNRPSPPIHLLPSSPSKLSTVSSTIVNMPSPRYNLVCNKNKKLRQHIISLKKQLHAKQSKLYRLKKNKKIKMSTKSIIENLLTNKPAAVKNFISMQLLKGKQKTWTLTEKNLALQLYYKSPSAYKFMRTNLEFALPSVRTIQNWLKVASLTSGVNSNFVKKLILKSKTMSTEEKYCVVCFDEFALQPKLEYNSKDDYVEGYEDLGELGRKEKKANTALVFLIRGLLYNWKIPFCYYISSGPVKATDLKKIIPHVLEKIQLFFTPFAVICDQGTNNRKAFSILGATEKDPFITISNTKIYTIYDTPHLVKSLRNNFCNPNLQFIVNKKEISWCDIEKTFELDQKSKITRCMLKITPTHLHPNAFQKMRVKYATQIFSNTVAASIETAFLSGDLKSSTAQSTASFIRYINNLFDCLNSKHLNDHSPYRKPLSINNSFIAETLEEALQYFSSIEVFDNRQRKRGNIYCLQGFRWTIKAILMLWNDLKQKNVKYLLTYFLNQDPLENLFSVIRTRGGYNPKPSVRQFRITLQYNINIRIFVALDTANCESQDMDFVELIDSCKDESIQEDTDVDNPEYEHLEDSHFQSVPSTSKASLHNIPVIPEKTKLETCSSVYVAGYLAHKVVKKFSCLTCEQNLTKINEDESLMNQNELYILQKDYSCEKISYLKVPTSVFSALVLSMLQKFNIEFEKFKIDYNLKKVLEKSLTDYFEHWLNEIECCKMHKLFIIRLLIKMKIWRNLRWESIAQGTMLKHHRKLSILTDHKLKNK